MGHNPLKRVQRTLQAQTEQEYASNDTEDVEQPLASLDQVRKPRRYNSILVAVTPDNNGPRRRPRSNSGLSSKPVANNGGNNTRVRKALNSI